MEFHHVPQVRLITVAPSYLLDIWLGKSDIRLSLVQPSFIAVMSKVTVKQLKQAKKHEAFTVGIRCIQLPDVFPLISIVNKSCNIEQCVNNMLQVQIIHNMMVSQCSEFELSMFRGTTLSGQHPLIYVWVQNLQKYSTPWSHWYIIISSSKP